MLDLSEEVDEENIGTCKSYLERMATMKVRRSRGGVKGAEVRFLPYFCEVGKGVIINAEEKFVWEK